MSDTAETRVIAEFSDYSGLLAALRATREMRNISFERLDEIVGAPTGYFSKVLSPNGERKLTMQTMCWAFAGLGVKCILTDDPEMLKRIKTRLDQRDNRVVRSAAVHVVLSTKFMRQIGAKGGTNSRKNLGKRYTKKISKNAALIRWKDVLEAVQPVRLERERRAKRKSRTIASRDSGRPAA